MRGYMVLNGVRGEILKLPPRMARTSSSAAKAVGCSVGQIAKNIVLSGSETYLVVLSGDRRVDVDKVSAVVGERLSLMKPAEILEKTGYPVGGVPPFGHRTLLKVLVDKSITRFDVVYTSGGSEDTLLKIEVGELLRHLKAPVVDVST